MRKKLLPLLLLAIFSISGYAQTKYEYGTPDDLKSLTTYAVDTDGNIKIRDKIISIISKALPNLKLLNEPSEADVRLYYSGGSEVVITGATQVYSTTVIGSSDLAYGSGLVCVDPIGSDKTKLRVVVQFANRRDNEGEASPHIKFAKEFVKVYKKGNGLK